MPQGYSRGLTLRWVYPAAQPQEYLDHGADPLPPLSARDAVEHVPTASCLENEMRSLLLARTTAGGGDLESVRDRGLATVTPTVVEVTARESLVRD